MIAGTENSTHSEGGLADGFGCHSGCPIEEVDDETFDRIMAVNNRSIYLGAKAIVPGFKKRRYGVILSIASTGGVSRART